MALERRWVQTQKLYQPTVQQSSHVSGMVVLPDLDAIEVSNFLDPTDERYALCFLDSEDMS